MGIDRLQNGDVDKAIAVLSNETAHRRQQEWRLLAHFHSCAGRHETAYELYLKAFTQSVNEVDAFELNRNGRGTRAIILDDIVDDGSRFFRNYSDALKKNLKEWHQFLSETPGYAMRSLPSLADAMGSREFQKLDELQRAMVIDPFAKAAAMEGKFGEFWKLIRANPDAWSFYMKYF